jgi:hypothetical protein
MFIYGANERNSANEQAQKSGRPRVGDIGLWVGMVDFVDFIECVGYVGVASLAQYFGSWLVFFDVGDVESCRKSIRRIGAYLRHFGDFGDCVNHRRAREFWDCFIFD